MRNPREVVDHQLPEYLASRESAKRGERYIQVTTVLIAVLCVAASSLFVAPIDTIRMEKQLTLDPEATHGLPPDISLLTKTGTFRALAIDFLFMRLERLKEENKYYELNKLSMMICKLAPRFPSVWKYAAWNMAYNISVTQYTPQGRWYWVRKGINLIRNQGLRFNDKSVGLYLELAWMFWHKVGDFMDDHHWTYKRELAVEMERVLGPPPVALNDEEIVNHFAAVAHAPAQLSALLAEDPEAMHFVERLATLQLTPDKMLLDFAARHLRSELRTRDFLAEIPPDAERTLHEARIELLTHSDYVDVRDRILACLRHQTLRDDYNMDPQWMLQLMKDYGPLDWRLPYMHALYWSSRGDMVTKGQLDLDENDSMNTVRYIFFGLKYTIKRGKLILEPNFDDPKRSYLELLPDSRFIEHLHQTYLRLGKEQFGADPRFIEGTAGPSYSVGHFTDLEDGIRQLYTEGGSQNVAQASGYYAYLREYNRDSDTGLVQPRFLQPLEQFVMREFWSELSSFKRANALIGAWVLRSLKHLSLGEVDQAIASMERAKQGWHYYMEDKGTDPGKTKRRHLAPLRDMRADALVQFMQQPSVFILHKARLWNRLEMPTKRAAYDKLAPYFTDLCAAAEPAMNPDKAFPGPPEMEEFRRTRPNDFGPDESIDHGEKG